MRRSLMVNAKKLALIALLIVAMIMVVRADAITEWNIKAGDIVVESGLETPPCNRALAIVQTAVYEAVNAITRRYPASGLKLEAAPGASVDAAVAAANRATLA